MVDLLMTLGFLLLLVGLPTSIATTIIFAIRKKKVKTPLICIPLSIALSFVCLAVGASMYSGTDEYKKHEAKRDARETREIEEFKAKTNIKENEEKNEVRENVEEEQENRKDVGVKNKKEPKAEKTEETQEIQKENKNVTTAETTKEDEFLAELKNVLSSEVAEKAYDILSNQIGFSNLEYKSKMEGMTNYEIQADGYIVVLTASDDVYRVFIPNSLYVFYEDGEVKLTFAELENKTIDQYDKDSYYIIAQEIVCSGLKNPSSAKFPSIVMHPEEIAMQKNGDIVAVQSYVEAKNDFGAKVRNNWTVEFKVIDISEFSYELIYANVGGNEVGEFIKLE